MAASSETLGDLVAVGAALDAVQTPFVMVGVFDVAVHDGGDGIAFWNHSRNYPDGFDLEVVRSQEVKGSIGLVSSDKTCGSCYHITAQRSGVTGETPWRREVGEKPCRVLYVDGQMRLELTLYRSRGLDLGVRDLSYLHHEMLFEKLGMSLSITLQDHREALMRLIEDLGIECLVLDNLSSLPSGVDENKGNEYEPIGQWLLNLRRRFFDSIRTLFANR